MKTKFLIFTTALWSAVSATAMLGQSGSSGSGSGSGSAGATASGSGTSGAGSSATGASPTTGATSTGATGTTTGVSPTAPGTVLGTSPTGAPLATPNMSTSMPSRSVADPTLLPGAAPTLTTPSLPPKGVTTAPGTGAVSPLTGLPTAQIPTSSGATQPVRSDGTVIERPATPATAERAPIVPAGAESLPAAQRAATRARAGVATATDLAAAANGPRPAVRVTTPPPEPREEAAPFASRGNQVWVPGHYTWSGSDWTWVAGAWQRPPSRGATWMAGSYDPATRQWTEGYWLGGGSR